MVKKLRVSLALQPDRHRASSPTRPSPKASRTASCRCAPRSGAHTDNDRTGMIPFAFEQRHGLRALCRLGARRAALFRQARRHLSRRRGRLLPRPHGRPARRAARRARHHVGLGEPPRHAVPGGAAQALSRDARRRCWSDGASRGALGLLGRPSLRRGRARCRLGPRQGLDGGRSVRRCATRCRARRCRRPSAHKRPATSRGGPG